MKTCPNCSFQTEPTDTECPKCGIIFEKWEGIEAGKREAKKDNVATEGEENSDIILEPLAKCQKCGSFVDPMLDKCPSCGDLIRGDPSKRLGRVVYLGGIIFIIAVVIVIPQISKFLEQRSKENERREKTQIEAELKEEKRVQEERFLSRISYHYQRALELFNAKKYEEAKKQLSPFFDFNKEDYKDVLTMYNKIIIDDLEKKAKEVPEYRLSENLKIYEELLELDPSNPTYKQKVSYYQAKHEKQRQEEKRQWVTANYDLELLRWSWSRTSRGYVTAKGLVKNISDRNLQNVEALVTWHDENGNFIDYSSALIEYNTLLSGQTSPFEVLANYNPAMQKASIKFKTWSGKSLSTYKK